MGVSLTAIGAYVVGLTGIEASGAIALSATAYTAVGAVTVLGLEYGVNALLAPGMGSQDAGQQQFTVRQPIPARRRYYGKNKASGPEAFIQTKDGNLYQVILIASHEIEFLEHWVGDRVVTLDGSGNVTNAEMMDDAFYRFHILAKAGNDSQTAHATLISDFPTLWTSDHRLRGIANVLFKQDGVEAKKFTRFYPGGAQQYRAVFNGARVWDVNDSGQDMNDSTTWDLGHDNAANVILNFLTSPDGMRIPLSAITPSLSYWQTAAAVCDETVTLADSSTDKRYRIAGGYDLDVPPKETLAKMLSACDGSLAMRPNGSVALKVGKWDAPSVTLDDNHIRAFSLPKGYGPLRQSNEIKASFVDPNQDFQPVEAEPLRDEDDISLRGTVLSKALDLTFVPYHNQARRLMKVASYRANPQRVGTITTDFYGLNSLGERTIHDTIAKRNIDLDMEVTSFKIDMATMSCVIGVCAMSSSAYDFDATEEEGEILIPTDTGSGNPDVPAPASPYDEDAVNSSGTVTASCQSPNDVNVYACRIWRGSSTFGAATDISGAVFCSPNQLILRTDAPGTGTWKYWFTAESASGNASSPVGPKTVVV